MGGSLPCRYDSLAFVELIGSRIMDTTEIYHGLRHPDLAMLELGTKISALYVCMYVFMYV